MAEDTLIQQGHFTSDGTDKIIPLRSDVDWVEVINLTNVAAATQWDGLRWYWQREMTNDDAVVEFHAAASQVVSMSTAAVGFNGVTYRGIARIDSRDPFTFTGAVAAGTNATRPVYTVAASTSRLQNGSIARVYATDQESVNGLDFSVDAVTTDVDFRLANTLQVAPGIVAGGNGSWMYLAPDVTTYDGWKPKKRVIGNITQANPGVVTTLVDHNYQTGQAVKLVIPSDGEMTELNGVTVTVTRVNASTFSIGIDTTGYTAFNFPLAAEIPVTFSQVIPIGQSAAYNTLTDGAFGDEAYIGIILGTSVTAGIAAASPGGTNGDVIKWRAGKSFRYNIG